MRRLLPILLTLTALAPWPSSAAPTSNAKILDYMSGGGDFYGNDGFAYASFGMLRTTTPAPAVDPGSLFPVVIDPNNPPALPAGVTDEEISFSGQIFLCDLDWYCNFYSTTEPTGVVIEDLPARGNSISWTESGVTTGGLGDLPFTLTFTLSRPAQTRLAPFGGYQFANPWIEDSDIHFDARAWQPIMFRDGYVLSAELSTALGDFQLAGSGSFHEYVDADAIADAP